MGVDSDNPYDIVGVNHKMPAENIKKRYVAWQCWHLLLEVIVFVTVRSLESLFVGHFTKKQSSTVFNLLVVYDLSVKNVLD